MYSATDVSRSLKRYFGEILGADYDVRPARDEPFERPSAVVRPIGGLAQEGTAYVQDLRQPYEVYVYPPNTGATPETGTVEAEQVRDVIRKALLQGGVAKGKARRLPVYNYDGIAADSGQPATLSPPGSLVATAASSGGSLATATYFYKVTARNAAGETTGSSEVSVAVTGPNGKVTLTWAAVFGATEYRIYRGTSANGQNVYYKTTTNSFVDTGAAATAGTVPGANTATTQPYDYLPIDGISTDIQVDPQDDSLFTVTVDLRVSWSDDGDISRTVGPTLTEVRVSDPKSEAS